MSNHCMEIIKISQVPEHPLGVTVAATSVLVDPVRLAMAESLLAVAECPPCPDCPDLEDDPPTEESLRGG